MQLSSILATGLAAVALMSGPALAQQSGSQDYRATYDQWQKANNETVSAERIMSGDVTDGFNMIGRIENLILNEQGNRIEYVLYEVPHAYRMVGGDDGFVRWDNIALERGLGNGVDVRIAEDASPYAKEELTITRSEADSRLVSRIVGGNMMFRGGIAREIDDILFDPKSGMITHFVVELDEDSLFNADTRRIPAAMVNMDARGNLTVAQPVTYDWEVWAF